MSMIVTSLAKHKKFLVKFVMEYEDEESYHRDMVTTEVVIPEGKPMIELLADTIFKCLAKWATYDETMKEASIQITYYTRLCDEVVVGFIDIDRRGCVWSRDEDEGSGLNQYSNTLVYF